MIETWGGSPVSQEARADPELWWRTPAAAGHHSHAIFPNTTRLDPLTRNQEDAPGSNAHLSLFWAKETKSHGKNLGEQECHDLSKQSLSSEDWESVHRPGENRRVGTWAAWEPQSTSSQTPTMPGNSESLLCQPLRSPVQPQASSSLRLVPAGGSS